MEIAVCISWLVVYRGGDLLSNTPNLHRLDAGDHATNN